MHGQLIIGVERGSDTLIADVLKADDLVVITYNAAWGGFLSL